MKYKYDMNQDFWKTKKMHTEVWISLKLGAFERSWKISSEAKNNNTVKFERKYNIVLKMGNNK